MLFSLLCLLSCYSYKNITIENKPQTVETPKTYKLKLTDNNVITVKSLKIENESYTYTDDKGVLKTIPKNEVVSIEQRKFSYGKTIGLSLGSLLVVGVTAIYYSLQDLHIGSNK